MYHNKHLGGGILLSLFAALFILAGCSNSLVPTPVVSNEKSSSVSFSDTIVWGAPKNVSASQGLKGRIELSWTAVNAASRYYIYEADSALSSNFSICGEVLSTSTTFTIDDCKSGADKYYRVTAVKKNGLESEKSSTVHGTSLATPEITDISEGSVADNMSIVKWWMGNVSEDTYLTNVRYTVYCFDESGNEVAVQTLSGAVTSETQVTFSGLESNTNYYYQVEAYNITDSTNVEKSDKKDKQTAYCTRPMAVENVEASTKGLSENSIQLTFTLPEKCSVLNSSTKMYDDTDLYFKIYRKLKDSTNAYELVDASFDKTDFGSGTYTVGESVTWTDPTASPNNPKRGKQYSYKIQSFVEGKDTSSELSYTEVESHLISEANITTQSIENEIQYYQGTETECDYTQVLYNEEDIFDYDTVTGEKTLKSTVYSRNEKTTFTFAFSFETFDLDSLYTYSLCSTRYPKNADTGEIDTTNPDASVYEKFDSIESVNSYVKTILVSDTTEGYYKFRIYVTSADYEAGEPSAEQILTYKDLLNTILVTSSTDVPTVEEFTAQSGYKDKIIFSWKYDPTVSYSLFQVDENNNSVQIASNQDVNDAITFPSGTGVAGDTANFSYSAESGFEGRFELHAYRGVTVSSDAITAATLATANATFTSPSYRNIELELDPVNQATSYKFCFEYSDTLSKTGTYQYETSELILTTDNDGAVSFSEDSTGSYKVAGNALTNGKYQFTIKDVAGFDDAKLSGKSVTVKVITKNATTNDETSSIVEARTLGPALTGISATKATNADSITVTWKKVNGATGYFILRDRWDVKNENSLSQADGYYVSASDLSIKNAEGNAVSGVTVTYLNGIYTLTDTARQITSGEPQTWEKNQDYLAWGYPFHYTAFPVSSSSHIYDITAEGTNFAGDFAYKNINSVSAIGSVKGFGHDVVATKSTDPHYVTISFTVPYGAENLTPVLYRRAAGSSENFVKQTAAANDSGDFAVKLTGSERCSAFEYAVDFSQRTSGVNGTALYKSYISDLDTKLDTDTNNPTGTGCSPTEKMNKGYAFAIKFTASNIQEGKTEGYSEQFTFTPWDYSERAVGPVSTSAQYTIQINNYNKDWAWADICTYTQSADSATDYTSKYDDKYLATFTAVSNGVRVTPTFDSDGSHYGILRVLRDYKHYARVRLEGVCKDEDGNSIWASYSDNDEVYTYRKISDEEFARCISLIVADSVNQAGVTNGNGTKSTSGATGTFKVITSSNKTIEYGTSGENYQHIFRAGLPGNTKAQFTSPFVISMNNASSNCAQSDGKLFHLPETTITVSATSDDLKDLASYNGTLTFSLGEAGSTSTTLFVITNYNTKTSYNAVLKKGSSNTINITGNQSAQENAIPLSIGSSYSTACTSYNEDRLVYKGNWWN